jgi:hypothetical protein
MAQFKIVSIQRDPVINSKSKSARTVRLPPLPLPFWDDFSFNNSKYYPSDTIWENSQTVWVNSGMGVNPPSINVATFDGYDSLGRPHTLSLADVGYGDSLVSRRLKLAKTGNDLGPEPIYISFFYQPKGNGEAPDAGDVLILSFKDDKLKWNEVWTSDQSKNLDQTKFTQDSVLIADDKYRHNNFQFRFQNKGRLTGPYDTWNLDYVYVNNGKLQSAPFIGGFPDRAVVYPLTTPLNQYSSVPVRHFFSIGGRTLTSPDFYTTNRRIAQVDQYKISSSLKIDSKTQGNLFTMLQNSENTGEVTIYNTTQKIPLKNLPADIDNFKNEKDSLTLTFEATIEAGDGEPKIPVNPLDKKGDFDPIVFKGIKFKINDKVKSTFLMKNYYAYDDGTAEYGAVLTGVGTQVAYEYNLITPESQIITGIDIYLPTLGGEKAESIQLNILSDLTGNESDYLLKLNKGIVRNSLNRFLHVEIPNGVVVPNKFYLGWKVNTADDISVGLDRNTDSGDKVFVNTSGTWVQNIKLKGSLMLRPVFGVPIIVGLESDKIDTAYPNPTKGTFYLSPTAAQILVYNIAGQEVRFDVSDQYDNKQVTIFNPTTGLHVVRYFDKVWHTEKIMVQP